MWLVTATEVGEDPHGLGLIAESGGEPATQPGFSIIVLERRKRTVEVFSGLVIGQTPHVLGIDHVVVPAAVPQHAALPTTHHLTWCAEVPESNQVGPDEDGLRHKSLHIRRVDRNGTVALDGLEWPTISASCAGGGERGSAHNGLAVRRKPFHLPGLHQGVGGVGDLCVGKHVIQHAAQVFTSLVQGQRALGAFHHAVELLLEGPGPGLGAFGVAAAREHQAVTLLGELHGRRRLNQSHIFGLGQARDPAVAVVKEKVVAHFVHHETEKLAVRRVEETNITTLHVTTLRYLSNFHLLNASGSCYISATENWQPKLPIPNG